MAVQIPPGLTAGQSFQIQLPMAPPVAQPVASVQVPVAQPVMAQQVTLYPPAVMQKEQQ